MSHVNKQIISERVIQLNILTIQYCFNTLYYNSIYFNNLKYNLKIKGTQLSRSARLVNKHLFGLNFRKTNYVWLQHQQNKDSKCIEFQELFYNFQNGFLIVKVDYLVKHHIILGLGGQLQKIVVIIILVQEKNGHRKGAWGTPGGLVDHKESIIQAVLREVKEETNLDCKVEDVLYFREMHDARYGKTDMYFAFRLKCQNEQQITICEQELMDYRWVPITEILEFLKKENQKQHVINFYKSVQERLVGDDFKYMKIEEREEMYSGLMKYYTVFKPRF